MPMKYAVFFWSAVRNWQVQGTQTERVTAPTPQPSKNASRQAMHDWVTATAQYHSGLDPGGRQNRYLFD